MKKFICKVIVGAAVSSIALTGCGMITYQDNNIESAIEEFNEGDNASATATTESTTEDVVDATTEISIGGSVGASKDVLADQNVTSAETATEVDVADDYNDFVEVTYEHVDYPKADDGNPDYSGIYCSEGGSSLYGGLSLIKQEDGSYYCYFYEYRAASIETKAYYKSDNLLEVKDEEGTTGEITIDGDAAYVSVTDSYGNEYEFEYTNYKHEYPDLSKYTGQYDYIKGNGDKAVVTVGYDENGAPLITVVEDGKEDVEFTYDPYFYKIYNIDDDPNGEILYAAIERECTGPDSELFSFEKGYDGNKVLFINLNEEKPLLYYKNYEPEVLH